MKKLSNFILGMALMFGAALPAAAYGPPNDWPKNPPAHSLSEHIPLNGKHRVSGKSSKCRSCFEPSGKSHAKCESKRSDGECKNPS